MVELTKEFIEKGDKEILRFMGFGPKSNDNKSNIWLKNGIKEGYHKFSDMINITDLHYHDSYDWLMPVLDKIENLKSLKEDSQYFHINMYNYEKESIDYGDEDHPYWEELDKQLDGCEFDSGIEKPKLYTNNYVCSITKVGLFSRNMGNITTVESKDRLTAIYITVVKFIDWYVNY